MALSAIERKSFGGRRTVSVPRGAGSLGRTRSLGRSGTVRRATPGDVKEFQKKQAKKVASRSKPRGEQRKQVERAGKALGRSDLVDKTEIVQRSTTVRRGKSGRLEQTTPDPEVQVDGRNVEKEARDAVVQGSNLFAGDLGTSIILSEVRRRGLKGRRAMGAAQKLSREAGLSGFKSSKNLANTLLSSKTFGIPNVLLAIAGAGLANLSAGAAAGPTTSSGAGATPTGVAGGSPQFIGGAKTSSQLAQVGAAPVTAGGAGFIGPGKSRVAVKGGAFGAGGGGTSAFGVARQALRGAQVVSSLLGSGSSGAGGVQTQPTGQSAPQFPQLEFAAPEQRTRTLSPQRQTRTPGGGVAAFRSLRSKFGGTATASLFRPRKERFGARTRGSTLGGRR